jgi:hypothetical protein
MHAHHKIPCASRTAVAKKEVGVDLPFHQLANTVKSLIFAWVLFSHGCHDRENKIFKGFLLQPCQKCEFDKNVK